MKPAHRIALTTVVSLVCAQLSFADPKASPHLVARATYDTLLGMNGAEIISVRHTDGIAALTNVAGSVDVLDLSNPLAPRLLCRVAVNTAAGTPNSVAIHPHHDYFLVVTGTAGVVGTVQAYRVSSDPARCGSFLASAAVGIEPDSIAIAPNGKYAVIANEAEGRPPISPAATGDAGGAGSLSLVDLTPFHDVIAGQLAVTNIPLSIPSSIVGLSTGRTDDLARLPINNTPATIEPESVAFSHNSRYAYVTLQENNAVVRLEARTQELTFFGLGQTTHAADLTVNNLYQPVQVLTAFREPDGIALDKTGRFFVTADEGDTRTGSGAAGTRGGRTLSVFEADTGVLIGDTGGQIDDAAAAAGLYPDSRSNRGGSEPEGVDLAHHRGVTLAAVTLERANAVALVDVSDPASPTVIDVEQVGTGPEGVKFFRVGPRLFVAFSSRPS